MRQVLMTNIQTDKISKENKLSSTFNKKKTKEESDIIFSNQDIDIQYGSKVQHK